MQHSEASMRRSLIRPAVVFAMLAPLGGESLVAFRPSLVAHPQGCPDLAGEFVWTLDPGSYTWRVRNSSTLSGRNNLWRA